MKRKMGYYWVLLKGCLLSEVAFNDGTGRGLCWMVTGSEIDIDDEDMLYISPEPIEFPGINENGEFPNGRDAAKLLTL